MKRRPSLYLLLSALGGIFFSSTTTLHYSHYALLALGPLLILILLRRHLGQTLGFLLMIALLVASSFKYHVARYELKLRGISEHSELYEGQIIDVHLKNDGSKKLYARLRKADEPNSETFKVQITLRDGAAALKPSANMALRLRAKLEPMRKPLSPVHFDAFTYGLAHNILARCSISDNHSLWLGPRPALKGLAYIRQELKSRVFNALSPHQASLLLALIVGETSLFSEDQTKMYEEIGAQHLLAVSGLQVALIGALCFFILLPLLGCILRKSHYAHLVATLLTLLFLWFFVALCQWPKSAIRAALMASMLLIPNLLKRRQDSFDVLYLSAFISLLFDPLSIFDGGFLLSYAAVFGLISIHYQSRHLRAFIDQRSWLLSLAVSSLLASLAAFIATFGIVASFFGTLVPLSAIANFLLVPLASLLQAPAIVCALLGALINSEVLIKLGAFFAGSIEILVALLSDLVGYIIYLPKLRSTSLIAATLALFLLLLSLVHRRALLLMAGLFLLVIPASDLLLNKPQGLRVTVMAVGQGDASLFSMPSGHNVLIDAGGQPFGTFDPGQMIILPTLRRLGIAHLDALVITHPDPDHILGAFALIKAISIKEIWHSGFKPGHPLTERLLLEARAKNIVIKDARDLLGAHDFGRTRIEVLAPHSSGAMPYYEEHQANDNSLVLRITHEGTALLWPGDIEEAGEHLLLKEHPDLSSLILKAPHHGSKTSSTLPFIKAVNARYVIYSTGFNNRFNHPHSEVSARYHAHQAHSFNTATDGEITINIMPGNISLKSYNQSF